MSYAGDVKSWEAWQVLATDPRAVLVDVRTEAEWGFVGVPVLASVGKRAVMLSWQAYPGMAVDPRFAAKLEAAVPDRDASLYFICRSGNRSRAAAKAVTAAGYRHCFNVADGFEGDRDKERHRGQASGWKAAGLPWAQD